MPFTLVLGWWRQETADFKTVFCYINASIGYIRCSFKRQNKIKKIQCTVC